ncbi:hypothetical protein [Jeotgalibacillus salarius]|nr:hypothetical protein [Jeotgalibacillus salarius]
MDYQPLVKEIDSELLEKIVEEFEGKLGRELKLEELMFLADLLAK